MPATPTTLAPAAALRELKVDVLGIGITPATIALAADEIERWIAEDTPDYVCVTGMHGVVEAQSDPALRDVHNAAGMVVPDGMPMVWASHRVGIPWAERCYGPDLMLEMCRRAAVTGHRFYFYGGAEGTPERLRDRLVEQFPGLQVVGLHSPPFRPLTPEEDEAILDEIHASGADIVWVGLSTPKQERWMAAHAGRLRATAIGVGAAFDFHAGNVSQAPSWMQRAGLEWFYRLIQEPRRLFVRYAVGIPTFVLGIARRRPRLVPRNSITPTATGTPTQEKLQ